MGFTLKAKHRSKNVFLYQQGDINFILNQEPDSFAQSFARVHGPSACAMAFRVENAAYAYDRALKLGAKPAAGSVGPMELNIPAIEGIGGSRLYFVDRYKESTIYDIDFVPVENVEDKSAGLTYVDHLTHNVHQGRMNDWANFYERLFNFREIRFFDIKGQHTGLISKAMTSPCGKIKIPLNESTDKNSQIEEFLEAYNGEGIQHIALGTEDIYKTVEDLKKNSISFLDTPDTYYEALNSRLPGHNEDLKRMQDNKILMDGTIDPEAKKVDTLLLQIFTQTVIGPIFFEIIQRKKNEGFGEGNFQALFDAIEQDQIKRGVIKA